MSATMPIPAARLHRFQVGTVGFSRISRANLVLSLEDFFASRPTQNIVCVSNVHATIEYRRDEHLRRIQNGSFLTIADGQPVVYYGRLEGVTGIERIMGPDIMTAILEAPECRERRHFFLGGMPETLAKMETNLRARFPDMKIAGMLSPPFRKMSAEEEESQRREILSTLPDYIWVCFGAPKQEYWMEANRSYFRNRLLLGIGAGFAYHAGELKRAPLWAQKLACEWVWRLAQDPKRLWKRYASTNPRFALMMAGLLVRKALGRT
jgi:N-acetylglucosaminyldiphosphoundecaprenol N-acetyl-beta-D-mannosaminyltransferase